VAEFSDEHAEQMGVKATSIRSWTLKPVRRAEKPLLEVEAPKFDLAGQVDPSKQLTGRVVVRGLDKLEDEKFVLRVAYRDRELNVTGYCSYTVRPGMSGLRFTFPPPGNKLKESRPVVALFDVCRMKKEEGKDLDFEVLSNTITVVLDVAAASEKGEVPPGVKLGS
jgi:hypothetical protein